MKERTVEDDQAEYLENSYHHKRNARLVEKDKWTKMMITNVPNNDCHSYYRREQGELRQVKVPRSLIYQFKEEAVKDFKQEVESGSYKSLCSLGLNSLVEAMKSGWMRQGQKELVKEIEDILKGMKTNDAMYLLGHCVRIKKERGL